MKEGEERSRYTSMYLDPESRAKLDRMAEATDRSRSLVVRDLIHGADGGRDARLSELVAELADLLHLR